MNRHILLAILLAPAMGACRPPLHLGYDFGRAYTESLRVQADLTRPSVQHANYSLYGPEAAMIRINVQAAAAETDTEGSEMSGTRARK